MKDALPGREDGIDQQPIKRQDTHQMEGGPMEDQQPEDPRLEGELIHWFDLLGAVGVVALSAFVAGYISVKCF